MYSVVSCGEGLGVVSGQGAGFIWGVYIGYSPALFVAAEWRPEAVGNITR